MDLDEQHTFSRLCVTDFDISLLIRKTKTRSSLKKKKYPLYISKDVLRDINNHNIFF